VGKFWLLICLCVTGFALAQGSPDLDARMNRLTTELRCLVCQNQTLADSNAELAMDLKKQLREQLASGKTDQEAIDYLVQRYGEFVLYRPRLEPSTWLLWFGPFLILLAGLIILILKIRSRAAEDTP